MGGKEVWRGYFSSILERGLKGEANAAGKVTLASLARYVHDTVAEEVRRQQSRDLQPRLLLDIGNPEDVFNFVLSEPKAVVPIVHEADSPPSGGNLPRTWINPRDGAEMILIPAGQFQMGDDDLRDFQGRISNPRHQVRLSSYYIYKNLVTVRMYRTFCQATGRQMPPAPIFDPSWSQEEHPIVNVSWEDARAYCEWAGVKLPTEAQWEKAACWDAKASKANKYPWGDTWDASKLWCSTRELGDAGGTTVVGRFRAGASPYGVLDMAGNAWEWCQDWYDSGFWGDRSTVLQDPVNETIGERSSRVLRGGSWRVLGHDDFRAAYRNLYHPSERGDRAGFRACFPAE